MSTRGLKRLWNDFRRHPWLHFISVTTITVALVLVGAFLIFVRNVENVATKTNPNETATIYLKEGLSVDQVRDLRDKVFALPQVQQVTFKDRDSIVGEIQGFLGEPVHKSMAGSEVFPDVLEIELEGGTAAIENLRKALPTFDGIAEVDFSDGWLQQYRKIRNLAQFIGVGLLAALIIGCGFIIANFMGLRHQARFAEIELAKMMGAHRSFILGPFLWEGIIEGALGATAALALLYVATVFLSQIITLEWGTLLGVKHLAFLSASQLAAVLAVGLSMALIGSILVFFRFQENSRT